MGAEGSCIRGDAPEVLTRKAQTHMVMYLDEYAGFMTSATMESTEADNAGIVPADEGGGFGFAVVTVNGKEMPGGRITDLPWGPVTLSPSRFDATLRVRFYHGNPPAGFADPHLGANGLRCANYAQEWHRLSKEASVAPGPHVDELIGGIPCVGEIRTSLKAFIKFGAPLFTSLWLGLDAADNSWSDGDTSTQCTPKNSTPRYPPAINPPEEAETPGCWVEESIRRARLPGWLKAKVTIFRPSAKYEPSKVQPDHPEEMLQPDVPAFMCEGVGGEDPATCVERRGAMTRAPAPPPGVSLESKATLVEGLIRCVEESNRVVRSLHDHVGASQRSGANQAAVERLLAESTNLKQQLLHANCRARSEESMVEELTAKLEPLRSELHDARTHEATQNDRVQALVTELNALRQEFKQLHAEQDTSHYDKLTKDAMEVQANELQAKIGQIQLQLTGARSELATQRANADTLAQEKASAVVELTSLRTRLADARAERTEEVEASAAAEATLRAALATYRKHIDELTAKTKMLEDSMAGADQDSKKEQVKLIGEVVAARRSAEEREAMEARLSGTVEEMRHQILEFQEQSRRAQDGAREAEFKSKSHILSLKSELEFARQASQDEAMAAKAAVQHERATHQTIREKHLTVTRRHEEKHRDLHGELEEAKVREHSEMAAFQHRVFELNARVATREERLRHQEISEEVIASVLAEHRTRVDEMHSETRSLKNEALERDLKHRDVVLELQDELDTVRRAHQEEQKPIIARSESFEVMHEEKQEEVERRYRAEIDEARKEVEAVRKGSLTEEALSMAMKAQGELADQRRMVADQQARSERIQEDAAERKLKYCEEIQGLRAELSSERQSTQADGSAQAALEAALATHRNRIAEIQRQARGEPGQTSPKRSNSVAEDRVMRVESNLESLHRKQVEYLESKHRISTNEMEEACNTYAVAVSKLKDAHQCATAELDEARRAHDERVSQLSITNQGLTQELDKVRHSHRETAGELEMLRRETSSEVQMARDSLQSRFHTALQQVSLRDDAKNHAQLITELDEARALHAEDVGRLERAHRVTLGELGEARISQVGDMEKIAEDRQSLYAELEQERKRLEDYKRVHGAANQQLRAELDDERKNRERDVRRTEIAKNRYRTELEETRKRLLEESAAANKSMSAAERLAQRGRPNAVDNPLETKPQRILLRLFRTLVEHSCVADVDDQIIKLVQTSSDPGPLNSEVQRLMGVRDELREEIANDTAKVFFRKLDPKNKTLSGSQFEASLQKLTGLDRESLSYVRYLIETHAQHLAQQRHTTPRSTPNLRTVPPPSTSTPRSSPKPGPNRLGSTSPGPATSPTLSPPMGSSGSLAPRLSGTSSLPLTGSTRSLGLPATSRSSLPLTGSVRSLPMTPTNLTPPRQTRQTPPTHAHDSGVVTEEEWSRLFSDPRLTRS